MLSGKRTHKQYAQPGDDDDTFNNKSEGVTICLRLNKDTDQYELEKIKIKDGQKTKYDEHYNSAKANRDLGSSTF